MDFTNPLGWGLVAAGVLGGNHGCTLKNRNQELKREATSAEKGG